MDLDGTIADSIYAMKRAYFRFVEQAGSLPTDEEFRALNGPTFREIVHHLKRAHQLKDDEGSLLSSYAAIIDREYQTVAPVDGADDFLRCAAQHDCVVGVVTSNSRHRTLHWLKANGLAGWISFVVSGEDVSKGKPDPEPYLRGIELSSCPPEAVIAVEDSLQGARSAAEARLRTYVVGEKISRSELPIEVHVTRNLNSLSTLLWSKANLSTRP